MIRKNTIVEWKWGNGSAKGKVSEIFREPVSRTIRGNTVKRAASEDNPAYLILQDDGQEVLKSRSEVKRSD